MSTRHHLFREVSKQFAPTVASITADTFAANLFTLCGSPSTAVNATITIETGIWVGGSDAGGAAIQTGTWIAGSVVTLVNKGYIAGRSGGDAISLGFALRIDNTNGYIFGGGGDGGWGGDSASGASGGWGGGGQGYRPGSDQRSGPQEGQAGEAVLFTTPFPFWEYGGGGGNGGSWGNGGGDGAPGSEDIWGNPGGSGAYGGAAGYAVQKNNKGLTWLGGSAYPRVQGVVG